jgi:hypothetical protein
MGFSHECSAARFRARRSPPGVKTKEAVSQVLRTLAGDASREHISLDDLMQAMQERAHAALILLLALPNVVPVPPGTSGLLGVPLMFLTLQLAMGHRAWLPQAMVRRAMPRHSFASAVHRVTPWLERAETLLHPRLALLTGPQAARWVGGLCLLLSAILSLPIPLGNMLPAVAISMLALGLLEGDGLWVLCGAAIGGLATALASGVVYGLAMAAWGVIGYAGR